MTGPLLAALCLGLTLVNLASLALAARRLGRRRPRRRPAAARDDRAPVCGLESFSEETLGSGFRLDYPDYELVFCVADGGDPVVPLVRRLMAAHPAVRSRLIVGEERVGDNPKLNNCVRGWEAAAHDWIVLADSNVLMPPDYVQRLRPPGPPRPASSARPRSAPARRGSGPRSSARSSTPSRRAGNMPARASGSASPRARACCGTARSSTGRAGSGRSPPRSPRTRRRRSSCAPPGAGSTSSRRRSRSPSAGAGPRRCGRGNCAGRACAGSPSRCSSPPRSASAPCRRCSPLRRPRRGRRLLAALAVAVAWYGPEWRLAGRMGWHRSWRLPLACLVRDALLLPIWAAAWIARGITWRGNAMDIRTKPAAGLRAPCGRRRRRPDRGQSGGPDCRSGGREERPAQRVREDECPLERVSGAKAEVTDVTAGA